MGKTSSDLLA
jgi:hypothetical protein